MGTRITAAALSRVQSRISGVTVAEQIRMRAVSIGGKWQPARKATLGASSLNESERDPIKVFDVSLTSVGERAERQRSDRWKLSPTNARASERQVIKATLHTMALRG